MKKHSVLIILISLLYFSCEDVNRTDNLLQQIDKLKSENDSLERRINKTQNQNDFWGSLQDTCPNYWFNNNYEGSKFKKYGIQNPEQYIEEHLKKNTDLIPLKGVLGGKMRFGKIQVLGNKWIIAEYEDGHIYGKSLYLYKFKNGTELEFQLLESINP